VTGDGAKPRASAWTGVFRVKAHPGGEPWPYGPSWRERFSFLEGREQALDSLAYHLCRVIDGDVDYQAPELYACLDERPEFREVAFDAAWLEDDLLGREEEP
jgi:hypothetical protein